MYKYKLRGKSKILRCCTKLNTKKYTTRSSPPYSAAACPNEIMKGNDGNDYMSLSTYKTNVFRWYPYSKELLQKHNKKMEEMDESRFIKKIKHTLQNKVKTKKNKTIKNK